MVKVVAPDLQAGAPTGRNVSYDVDFLPGVLGCLELLHQPVELLGWIGGVDEQPPIHKKWTRKGRKSNKAGEMKSIFWGEKFNMR